MKTYADVVISCGASILGIHLLTAYENQAKSVVIMKPFVPTRRFDAVIVPRHDRTTPGKNVFVTDKALSLIQEETLREASDTLSQELRLSNGHRRIGLLVGGDTRQIQFERKSFHKIIMDIDRYSAESDSVLFATSSRRTPAWADEVLKKTFKGNGRCPLLVIANESNRTGVVGGILGLCDLIVVSAESISMVSEAVSSGKPVIVFMPSEGSRFKAKYRDFLERLSEEKSILLAGADDIYEVLKQDMGRAANGRREALSRDQETLKLAMRRVL